MIDGNGAGGMWNRVAKARCSFFSIPNEYIAKIFTVKLEYIRAGPAVSVRRHPEKRITNLLQADIDFNPTPFPLRSPCPPIPIPVLQPGWQQRKPITSKLLIHIQIRRTHLLPLLSDILQLEPKFFVIDLFFVVIHWKIFFSQQGEHFRMAWSLSIAYST
jgi:hypothetical protein